MTDATVRTSLRRAAKAVEAARETSVSADVGYLDGAEQLLAHHVDGDAAGSEAMLYPTPGALDTVQSRLSEVIDDVDEPAAEHLREARAEIIQAILLLDDRLNKGRPTSSWR